MSRMHKRCSYNIVRIENSTWNWCYSAQELQVILNELCCGQKLLRWMAELVGYADATPRGSNFLDLSYMGGNTLLIFSDVILEFDIRVKGLIGYRFCKPWNVHIRPVTDCIPEDYITNPVYFCYLKDDFQLEYVGSTVQEVTVESTDSWGFSAVGFDEEKASAAAEAKDLPNEIHFMLDNVVELCLYADQLEYYMIELKSQNNPLTS